MLGSTSFHPTYEGLRSHSLGFAGAMLVRNSQQMQILKDIGPMGILSQVGSIIKDLE
ncbi:MAG: hypothetical protein QNJ51_07755 [Calothrix sp. MO_167.B12]|nr:hypothetical protein [Calothrix sp. MO_167.B12]